MNRTIAPALVWMALATPGAVLAAGADDGQPLDITMEVIGKKDRIDDRLANRIVVPGVLSTRPLAGNAPAARERTPLLPRSPEREARIEQYRQEQAERRAEARERYRAWREQQQPR